MNAYKPKNNYLSFKSSLHFTFELFAISLLWLFCSLPLLAQDTTNQTQLSAVELDSLMTVSGDSLGVAGDVVIPVKHNIAYFDANIQPKEEGYSLEVTALDAKYRQLNELVTGRYNFMIDGEDKTLNFTAGKANVSLEEMPKSVYLKYRPEGSEKEQVRFFQFKEKNGAVSKWVIPTWVSILPPLIAILLALIFKEVITSLFLGIWIGVWMLYGFDVEAFFWSFLHTVDEYIFHTLTDGDHIAIIVFSLLIGGMVAIISRNGGMAGVVNGLSKLSNSARSSQLVTWLMGVAIFFDDYANTLVVGNTMRSLTDKFRVSREKLAYIVDSTAAPVAAIALITTWIGAELSYIGDVTGTLGISESPYSIFLNSLQYSFYPIFTLVFILFLAISNRDFGPMHTAEMRARTTGKVFDTGLEKEEEEIEVEKMDPIKNAPHRAINAILPVLVIIIGTFVGLWYTGMAATDWTAEITKLKLNANGPEDLTLLAKLPIIIGNSNSYDALIWSSTLAVTTAIALTLFQGIMSLRATMETMMVGIKAMMGAIIVLVLAWSLAQITKDLHTADFLTSLLVGNLNPLFLPVLIFLLAALIAFSTGSSWSTMAILYPIALPLAWAISQAAGNPIDLTMQIFYAVTSSVLAGSVLGDHCSPISDTTILSSLASQCNHIDHVRTQMPYALTVGTVSSVMITLSMYMQLPSMVSFGAGLGILLLIVLLFGKRVPEWATLQREMENQEPAPVVEADIE